MKTTIKGNKKDGFYIDIPEEIQSSLNWNEGDTLTFKKNNDGSVSIKKVTVDLKLLTEEEKMVLGL